MNTGDISGILCIIDCKDATGRIACALTHIEIDRRIHCFRISKNTRRNAPKGLKGFQPLEGLKRVVNRSKG